MLHRLLFRFGRRYPDRRLAWLARRSVADDALLADVTCVRITSAHGVIRLTGRVPHVSDKVRIEATIRATLTTAGLPYGGIRNALQVSQTRAGIPCADHPVPRVSLLSAR
jgi:hypothetical protein